MTNAIVFSSQGNTKLLAQQVWTAINPEDNRYFGETSDEALCADTIYVGFWTDKGTCDKKTEEFLSHIKNKEVFLFGSAGFGGSQEYFDKIVESTKKNLDPSVKLKGAFMCQGKMRMKVRERYESLLQEGKDEERINMLIENFDRALTHPDNDDLSNLKLAVENAN